MASRLAHILNSDEDPLVVVGNYIASKHGEHPESNPARMALFNASTRCQND
jgi:hypothetical protein